MSNSNVASLGTFGMDTQSFHKLGGMLSFRMPPLRAHKANDENARAISTRVRMGAAIAKEGQGGERERERQNAGGTRTVAFPEVLPSSPE